MNCYVSPVEFAYSPDCIKLLDAWLREDTPGEVRDALKQINLLHDAVLRLVVRSRDPLEELKFAYEELKKVDGDSHAMRVRSCQWLDDFCERTGDLPDLDDIMKMARHWAKGEECDEFSNDGEYIWCGDMHADCKIPPEFWTHLERAIAAPIPERFKAERFARGG